jgi:hypothetical protein
MSRIIAAKEAEVEDMREATDGSMARLRALIEHKAKKQNFEKSARARSRSSPNPQLNPKLNPKLKQDTENTRLQRSLKIFMNHCFKAQCRYCGREVCVCVIYIKYS